MVSRYSVAGAGFVALAFIVSLVSCRKSAAPPKPTVSPALVAAENMQRQKLNLRQIAPSWSLYRNEGGEEVWAISSAPRSPQAKLIHRDATGKLQWEEDYYWSGLSYATAVDGVVQELLIVHYDYEANTVRVDYCGVGSAETNLVNQITATSTNAEKLSIADQILKLWKMQRL